MNGELWIEIDRLTPSLRPTRRYRRPTNNQQPATANQQPTSNNQPPARPGAEKKALDISFLLTPVVNLAMPIVTKNPPDIFWANLVALGACYGYGFLAPDGDGDDDASLPAPIKFALKALDFGAGRERGAPMEMREKMEEQARLEREDRQQRAAQGAVADESTAAAAAEEPQEVL